MLLFTMILVYFFDIGRDAQGVARITFINVNSASILVGWCVLVIPVSRLDIILFKFEIDVCFRGVTDRCFRITCIFDVPDNDLIKLDRRLHASEFDVDR